MFRYHAQMNRTNSVRARDHHDIGRLRRKDPVAHHADEVLIRCSISSGRSGRAHERRE